MPSNQERDRGVGYPKLSQGQINLIVDNLVWVSRQRNLGADLDLCEKTITDLVGFYTRRWGLPPALTQRLDAIRELAAKMEPAP